MRIEHARAYCAVVLGAFWKSLCEQRNAPLGIRPPSLTLPALTLEAQRAAESTGQLVATFPVEDAGFLIGSIYTVMLPAGLRSELGAYYTPPPLVARLLDQAEAAGFDMARGSAIDPACGGGAFLAPLAQRMVARCEGQSPAWILARLAKRLKGLELDPFAAWMTQVLVEAAVLPICIAANCRMADVVEERDALEPRALGHFDLVIGNPPYGRVKLSTDRRQLYARSLFGHANLYGLFTDLALRLLKPSGVLAYLTPTSFLGGQYFQALRKLIVEEVSPVSFDLVTDREGVFDDVMQETLLATYIRCKRGEGAFVSNLIPKGLHRADIQPLGAVHVPAGGSPWLLPRQPADVPFMATLSSMSTRLVDLGYAVSTGPLVWNRHKSQLRTNAAAGSLPLIWAESVTPTGFEFSASRRNHVPYIAVRSDQTHLITRAEGVLVQRTTSKEQERRLQAAVLPQSFIDQFEGAVVENHLNLVHAPCGGLVSPKTIAALLGTSTVDRVFRCINGSVAVSAYELNAIPLPTPEQLQDLEQLISRGALKAVIERRVAAYYGTH